MKKDLIIALIVIAIALPSLAADTSELKTEKEKVSYSIGFSLGSNFKRQSVDVDIEQLIRGMNDAINNRAAILSAKEQRDVMTAYQKKQNDKMASKQGKTAAKNKKAGNQFLSENKRKPGVVTLKSGLQYKVIVEGKGPKPAASDTVETHYRGTLIDGTEFDSSYRRGEPASFPVMGVIKGWTEALQLMNVGSKWELYIPADLAYGDRGAGGQIGPGATLIFEIELLRIVKG